LLIVSAHALGEAIGEESGLSFLGVVVAQQLVSAARSMRGKRREQADDQTRSGGSGTKKDQICRIVIDGRMVDLRRMGRPFVKSESGSRWTNIGRQEQSSPTKS
jgi:hypothetical protein